MRRFAPLNHEPCLSQAALHDSIDVTSTMLAGNGLEYLRLLINKKRAPYWVLFFY